MTGKVCLDCDDWKPLDDFYYNNRGILGRTSYCKLCQDIRGAKHREINRVKLAAYLHDKYLANIDAMQLKGRLYYKDNKAQMNKQSQGYYHANKDRINAKARAEYAKNKKAISAYRKKLYAEKK